MKTYRQGDVMLAEVESIPSGATKAKRVAGRIVLAYGERTGHAHAIDSRFADELVKDAERFLRVTKPVALKHEEHAEVELPPGCYRVVQQREYRPEGIINVAD